MLGQRFWETISQFSAHATFRWCLRRLDNWVKLNPHLRKVYGRPCDPRWYVLLWMSKSHSECKITGRYQPFSVHFNYMAAQNTPWSIKVSRQKTILAVCSISMTYLQIATYAHYSLQSVLSHFFMLTKSWCSFMLVLAPHGSFSCMH